MFLKNKPAEEVTSKVMASFPATPSFAFAQAKDAPKVRLPWVSVMGITPASSPPMVASLANVKFSLPSAEVVLAAPAGAAVTPEGSDPTDADPTARFVPE